MIIFGSPSRYVQGAGVLSSIGAEIGRIAPTAVLVLDPLIQDKYSHRRHEGGRARNELP